MRDNALMLLLHSMAPGVLLDAEGRSLLRTMGKAWGEEAPPLLAAVFRALFPNTLSTSGGNPAAAESRALAVAHLLPALITCAIHRSAACRKPYKI